jgi:hypothetical protein
MRYFLVDADSHSGFPNLALMKLSAWLKMVDDEAVVDLHRGIPDTAPLHHYDRVYLSTVFFQNQQAVQDYASQFEDDDIEIGGSGWDLASCLPEAAEHMMPDYDLYGTDYSMGFTSRGCIRRCGFCVVPKKEGHLCRHSPIEEFHRPDHNKIILLDNNFLASPNWKETLQYIHSKGLMVNFNQGLDIRLVDEEKAHELSTVQWYNWRFSRRGLHFAFDHVGDEGAVRKGLEILSAAGIRPYRCMFYVLVGYDSSPEQDMHRIMVLKELGAKPFVMVYNQNPDPGLRVLARWVNGRYHEFVPYDDFAGVRVHG